MAQVTVAYEDLSASAESLKNIGTYVDEVHSEINDLVSAFEPLSSKHNNCFGDVINALDDLEHAFRNYTSEVNFLAEQCTNAVSAFKDAEGDSIELSEAMKEFLSSAAAMVGLEDFDASSAEVSVGKNSDEFSDSNYKRASLDKKSATWNSIFEDSDADGVYEKINGTTVSTAENPQDDEKTKKTDPSGTEETPSDTSDGDDSYSSGGGNSGGGGGYSNGSSGTRVEYEKEKNTEQAKTEESKEENVTEVTPEKTDENSEQTDTDNNTETNTNATTDQTTNQTTDNTNNNTEETKTDDKETPAPATDSTQNDANDTTEVTYHTGGGYSEGDGYVPYTPEEATDISEAPMEPGTTAESALDVENETEGALVGEDIEEDIVDGLDDVVKSEPVKKIPVSNDPISTTDSGGGSSVIPIAAGLSAAAAAGLGAKAYMDHKKNNSSEDMAEFNSEEWNGDESTDIDYGDSLNTQEYLDDDYVAHEDNLETEKYGARNNEELADLQ